MNHFTNTAPIALQPGRFYQVSDTETDASGKLQIGVVCMKLCTKVGLSEVAKN